MPISRRLGRVVQAIRGQSDMEEVDPILLSGAYAAFVLNALGLGLGLLTQKLLANTLGPSGFGLYLYIVGWSNVAGLLCALEFSNAAVRFVSAYTATHEWSVLKGFLRRSHQIVGGTSVSVALLAFVVLLLVPMELQTKACAMVACALFPVTSLAQLQSSCLLGWKRVRDAQTPFQVLRPALFGLGILLLYRTEDVEFTAGHAVGLQVVATATALAFTWYFLRKAVPPEVTRVQPTYRTMEWVSTSIHFVAISIAQLVLSTQADLLFVGTLLRRQDVGLYGAASQFATLVGFGSAAIMVIVQPMIADLYAKRQIMALGKLVRQVIALALIVSVPVFFGILIFGRPLLRLYGDEFVAAYPVLVVLSASQLVAAVVGSLLGYLFTMTSHQRTATKIIGASAILNIALALALTYWFGIIGTASATAISTIVRSVALALGARRILNEAADRPAPAQES